jgi:hypothetical protein
VLWPALMSAESQLEGAISLVSPVSHWLAHWHGRRTWFSYRGNLAPESRLLSVTYAATTGQLLALRRTSLFRHVIRVVLSDVLPACGSCGVEVLAEVSVVSTDERAT